MISNEKQYKITKKQIDSLERELEKLSSQKAYYLKKLQQAMTEGLQSQIDELKQELQVYEHLKQTAAPILIQSFSELPQVLIRARIMRGFTQKELAQRLHMKEQQLQRYEAQAYAGVKLERLVYISEVLGVDLNAQAKLK